MERQSNPSGFAQTGLESPATSLKRTDDDGNICDDDLNDEGDW